MEFIDLRSQYRALRESIEARIGRVLAHGRFILGPEVRELETRLEEYTQARHCITVASGTDALLIALMALEVKAGDEVITTTFSFAAAAEVIALLGARPVLVDVEADTGNIDASLIEAAISPRTRAIVPVSLYGQPADMDEINAAAARHALPVIEDAAQSFGATYKGRRSCNLSTIGCTSFYPSKPLGCYGDGGAIFTSDDALARAMREIRVHGQEGPYRHARLGVNGRLDTIQCAVLLAKLERFDWEVRRRGEIAARYDERLRPLEPALRPLRVKPDRTSVYAQYTVRVHKREAVRARLGEAGVPTAVHYPLALHRQPAYAALRLAHPCPIADALAEEVLSLPMHADLDENSQDTIVDAVRKAVV
ncbi:MAG TPA: DegT/DnrJ/EryC1/StrS family aminotransferase [Burkholderiales bacterium]|nr:DegT/DnrJ/EryC1/StrS family aminotransferase [Burkholderiales bacterium]